MGASTPPGGSAAPRATGALAERLCGPLGAHELGRLLRDFRHLVASDGPLPFVRFPPEAFARALCRHVAGGASSVDSLARRCLAELAPAATESMRAAVRAFARQSFVPAEDRDAALAALATWDVDATASPPMVAIFAAQLGEGLGGGPFGDGEAAAAAPPARLQRPAEPGEVDRPCEPADGQQPGQPRPAGA